MPSWIILAIVGLFALLVVLATRSEGLRLFGPRTTRQLEGSAQRFCLDHCRLPDGSCPLSLKPQDCPLWQYVHQGLVPDARFDPSRPVETPVKAA